MSGLERVYVSKEEQERMFQKLEKALIENGYEYEFRDQRLFNDDKVDWIIPKTLFVNPSVLNADAENGMLYVINIYDKDGYYFVANLIMQNDEDVEDNFKYRGFTPPDVETVIKFIQGYDERFPELEEQKLIDYGCIC